MCNWQSTCVCFEKSDKQSSWVATKLFRIHAILHTNTTKHVTAAMNFPTLGTHVKFKKKQSIICAAAVFISNPAESVAKYAIYFSDDK